MLQYSYPRLDINVTKGMNHLLKSPFCVHPKTGKVCIPLNPKVVDQFDPHQVPTIMTLIEEINAFDTKENEQGESVDNVKRIKDYKKTSLNKPLHAYQEFLRGLENSQKGEKIIRSGKLHVFFHQMKNKFFFLQLQIFFLFFRHENGILINISFIRGIKCEYSKSL